MDWNITVGHPLAAISFAAYKDFTLGVATQYAGARLLEHFDLSLLPQDLHLALSDTKSEGFTTTRTVAQLREVIQSGEYSQLCIRQAVVQLCTGFESLFNDLCKAFSCPDGSLPESVVAYARTYSSSPYKLGNRTIRQIRGLHQQLSLDTMLNDDQVLVKLSAIIECRNCIVHSKGHTIKQSQCDRLRTYGFRIKPGDSLIFNDKILDDFLHYMAFHVRCFVTML